MQVRQFFLVLVIGAFLSGCGTTLGSGFGGGEAGPDVVQNDSEAPSDVPVDSDAITGADADSDALAPDTGPLAPSIAISLPVSATYVFGVVDVAATAQAMEPGASVVEVRFSADGTQFGVVNQAPWTAKWDTELETEGAHVLRATAKDSLGSQTFATVTVTVDRSKPTVAFSVPAGDTQVDGDVSPVAVVVTAADNLGLKGVEVTATNSGASVSVAKWSAPPFQGAWATAGLPSGVWTLTAEASDAAGHVAASHRTVTLNRGPTIAVVAPASGTVVSGVVSLQAQASDDLALASVTLFIDDTQVASVVPAAGSPSSGLSWSWDTTGFAYGPHAILAVAKDSLGRTASASEVVTVDQPLVFDVQQCDAALLACTAPAGATAEQSGVLHFLATLEDDNAQAQDMQVTVDGAKLTALSTAPYGFAWDSAAVKDGAHTLAFDVTTTVGEHATVTLQVLVNNCDLDHDGHAKVSAACAGDDCNDADKAVFTTAADAVGDGQDENCDGLDGVDVDGDGFASVASGGKDCDDNAAGTKPGATDAGGDGKDQNCDGVDGLDADGDGYASVVSGGKDCDDAQAGVHPGAKDPVVAAGCKALQTTITTIAAKADAPILRAAADGAGVVHIVWWSKADAVLKYQQAFGATSAIEIAVPTAWSASNFAAAAAPDGTVSIAAIDPNLSLIQMATRSVSGKWSYEQVAAKVQPSSYGIALAVDSQGKRHVAYGDDGLAELRYATDATGKWTVESVASKVLDFPAIAVTASGSVRIAYLGSSGTLQVASGQSGAWKTADTGIFNKYPRNLAVDANGASHIAWQTSWDQGLHIATDASGSWVDEAVSNSNVLAQTGALVVRPAPWGAVLLHGAKYYDPGLYASWKSDGVWQEGLVDASGALGSCAAVPMPDGTAAVAYITVDSALQVAKLSCGASGPVGVDENCDGIDGVDADGDKVASLASGGSDCDDADPTAQPGAKDTFGDGKDQNCDGADGVDGDGDKVASVASGGKDCNDANPSIYAGAKDTVGDSVDEDCDGADGADLDADGWPSIASGGKDCADDNPAIHPCADDAVVDGVDSNCDGKDVASCDDCVACTTDTPANGKCTHVLTIDGGPCEDGEPCTKGEICTNGKCSGGTLVVCDDGNVCTFDMCAPGIGCTTQFSYGNCDADASACTYDWCTDGKCVNYSSVGCDDGNLCTIDACDPKTGLCLPAQPVQNCCLTDLNCNDGDGCTLDACVKNVCQHQNTCCKADKDCSDGETKCTTDACNGGTCTHAQTGAAGCCTAQTFGFDFEAALNTWTLTNSASPKQGWQWWSKPPTAHGGSGVLYYGDPATGNFDFQKASSGTALSPTMSLPTAKPAILQFWLYMDTETGGYDDLTVQCVTAVGPLGVWMKSGAMPPMKTWTQVTIDLSKFQGQNVQVAFFFDTKDSTGNGGAGVFIDDLTIVPTESGGFTNECNDLNPCTADACDAKGVCLSTPVTATCDVDGSLCTLDMCSGGKCAPGSAKACDDGNACTDDLCDAVTGACSYKFNTAPCEDGNACTTSDTCAFGACQPGAAKICGVGEVCTDGKCQVPPIPTGMVLVPVGTFTMGCVKGDTACSADELPAHDVTLSAFYIDALEVSVAEYGKCVTAGFCPPPKPVAASCNWGKKGAELHPINCIGFWDAYNYCAFVGRRVPTEAEWERAARGDVSGTLYPWGDTIACKLAAFDDGSATTGEGCDNLGTSPVGAKTSGLNGFGLNDVTGNVWEWVADYYDPGYYALSPAKNPLGPQWGKSRIVRGGSWQNSAGGAEVLRLSNRVEISETTADTGVGFRCAANAP